MRISRKLLLIAVVVAVAGVCVSSASAETLQPWFHLSSGARPTYLSPQAKTVAVDEEQELTVTPGSSAGKKGAYFILSVNQKELGTFATEELAAFATEATNENIQKALEKAYGAGSVAVSGGPVSTEPLIVKVLNAIVVPPIEIEALFGSKALVAVLAAGEFKGPEVIATAVNVGDAEAHEECVKVTVETGKYKDVACTEEGEPSENEFEKKNPVQITDTLPPGLKAVSAELIGDGTEGDKAGPETGTSCSLSSPRQVSCTVKWSVSPFEQFEVRVGVIVQAGAKECLASEPSACEVNQVAIAGGGARGVHISRPVTISSTPTPFGVEDYELTPEEPGGAPDTQAGSHPFQLTTTFGLNETASKEPVAQAKDLSFRLPPGLIGNPHPFPRCTLEQFSARPLACPTDTILGVSIVSVNEPGEIGFFTRTAPLFNLEPQTGEPARFGFLPTKETPVFLDTAVRTGEGYGVVVNVPNITQEIGFVSSTTTFWGVPGAASHDEQRGVDCLVGSDEITGPCQPLETSSPPPFLQLPGSCTNEPLRTEVLVDSWDAPSDVLPFAASAPMPQLDGCNQLPFHASISATPDVQEASKPSGLNVDVHVPQEEALSAEGLAPTELRNITVTLPEGVDLNPSAADGLAACPLLKGREPGKEEQEAKHEVTGINLESHEPASCPNASKIANVEVDTPLLPNALKGFVYLASPQNFRNALPENPFSGLVAMYLVAEDPVSGTVIKLPGSVSLNQSTGQITSTFANNPQLPFEDAKLDFFGGERAPLATPQRCGAYPTAAMFEPWSAEPSDEAALRLHESSTFDITSGPGGGACPGSSLPFSPSLASGTTNINAGSFSELTTTLSRSSSDQALQSVTLHYPAGVSGLLSGVTLCGEAEANTGTCGPNSQIGETIVSVGVGGEPFTVTGGKVYITGPYHGAPFGLSIVNPAKAGPFDLQEGRPVVVRAKIEVNPITAALTVTTNSAAEGHAIPSIIEGFALQIQHVNVLINRPGFTFNPTNCNPQKVTGTMNSAEGASSPVEDPFQVTNCAALKFAPDFAVATSAKTSRADGASLAVKLSYPNKAEGAFNGPEGAYTNIRQVKVELPKGLPSRLQTLQKACTAAQFHADPAGCPAASIVGHAKATTPLIPVPLEGPAYFVSNGGEAFPNLIIVLQGYGVTIDLVGDTFISKAGVTSSTFKTVPDAPVGSFELNLPEGPYSALTTDGSLCKQKLVMPTEFIAQNGATLHQNTKIAVTDCPKAKRSAKKKGHRKAKHRHKRKGRRG